MKNVIFKELFVLTIALMLIFVFCNAEARCCVWVPGHWANGYYYYGHKVCYANRETLRPCWWRDGRRYCAY